MKINRPSFLDKIDLNLDIAMLKQNVTIDKIIKMRTISSHEAN